MWGFMAGMKSIQQVVHAETLVENNHQDAARGSTAEKVCLLSLKKTCKYWFCI